MMFDICNSPVSLTSQETLTEWNGMIRAFLAHGTATPTHLGEVLKQEPEFAMGHAARGLFSLMLGRAEMVETAKEAAQAAQRAKAQGSISFREDAWTRALDHWLAGRPTKAIAAMEGVLSRHPEDTLSAKVSHAIRFIMGDAKGMRRSIERVLGAHGPDHACRGFALGCHAFALEETGAYEAAEAAGREGLLYAPEDAWGLHAVTHVYDMTARADMGIQLIEENTSAWDHCNNFRYHVWWHKALLHMDRDETDVALGLYDAQIRADKTDDYRDISNATSLLVRLELEGMDVGPRWDELADIAQNRTDDGCVVFADLHYMLALTGADRPEAQAAMAARFARDAGKPGELQSRYADPGLAALAGLNAFAEGRYDAAFADLTAARPAMQSIGGSHAQRDVFERITIDAGLRAGRYEQTEAILADRLARRAGRADRFTITRTARIDDARRIPAQ
ncbi:tetratricopeptide repeat protein 38 family protein [Roseobacter cerasinus]|uniref:Tetratricopeptide repeat protein 38 n=1 Tax=Roseobacter cerasinus TaxID=2602289 RepID=A0A640VS26_9RHOB|nr:tetratricopeptide repeat protein [Roseobacter cerasinus]GFE50482.1 tetratricopeptide repeat protein 38 family protein [Roseobacter cerasinus]